MLGINTKGVMFVDASITAYNDRELMFLLDDFKRQLVCE
jgi:hypothetical protein